MTRLTSDTNGLSAVRLDVTPGRRVVHVHDTACEGEPSRIVHTPYVVVGVAWDTRTRQERVVLRALDGADAGGLYLFGLATFADMKSEESARADAEVVRVEVPERVAGVHRTGSGV